jgi:hypothetical protein
MNPTSKPKIPYPEMMTVVGRFIAKRGIKDICVLEFENGVIVTGSALYETGEVMGRRIETHVLSADDLQRLAKGG